MSETHHDPYCTFLGTVVDTSHITNLGHAKNI